MTGPMLPWGTLHNRPGLQPLPLDHHLQARAGLLLPDLHVDELRSRAVGGSGSGDATY